MIDIYLRAPDQPSLRNVLKSAGLIDSEGLVRSGAYLDEIGEIPGGGTAFYANLRLQLQPTSELNEALGGFVIPAPAVPYRVWAS